MKTLRERTQHAIDEGFTVGDMARATGKSSSAVSQWKSGDTKELKADSAAGLEELTGWNAQWWATGKGPRGETKNRAAASFTAREGVASYRPVAHDLSQAVATVDPPKLEWEGLMGAELPDLFSLEARDDSMAPLLSRGQVARFSRTAAPDPGRTPVLLRDRDGNHYIRHYRALRPGHWEAAALNPGYAALDSVRDGLEVIATMKGLDWF